MVAKPIGTLALPSIIVRIPPSIRPSSRVVPGSWDSGTDAETLLPNGVRVYLMLMPLGAHP
jgi:hypothetical protein